MTTFKFTYEWQTTHTNDDPEYRHTIADMALHISNVNLMKNEDIWSKTIRESALLSVYPLAMWLASSWWRLNWEPLPSHEIRPSVHWRMAHELGAADHGFVWPRIIFASDSEMMQIWASVENGDDNQSVRYLNGLATPAFIRLDDFQRTAEDLVNTVLGRLDAQGCPNTDLANLWQFILEDRYDPESAKYRRLEAKMGYDPDECPEELIGKALDLGKKMGEDALSELAPVYGRSTRQEPLTAIEEIAGSTGLIGVPQTRIPDASKTNGMPWQRAVSVAGSLRQMLGNTNGVIDNRDLCELLGLRISDVENWSPDGRNAVAIAVPESESQFKFIPRKRHPTAKRFELARFIGDYILKTGSAKGEWLTSTDLSTSRQKYQRAFAAEFLCPIAALQEFLEDDFSESAIEDATEYFQVSETTIKSLLVNNHLIPFAPAGYDDIGLPYQLVA